MGKGICRHTSLDMKRDEYRQWQKLSPIERLNAAPGLSIGARRFKDPNVPERLQTLNIWRSVARRASGGLIDIHVAKSVVGFIGFLITVAVTFRRYSIQGLP